MEQTHYWKKLIAFFQLSLIVWASAILIVFNALEMIEAAHAKNDIENNSRDTVYAAEPEDASQYPSRDSGESGANFFVSKKEQANLGIIDQNQEVTFRSNILSVATSPIKRLKINAADRIHLEDYFTIENYLNSLGPEQKNQIKVKDLPKHVQDNLNIPYISTYDRRLIRSILNMVTPTNSGGAGNEYTNIYRITKGHRSEATRDSDEAIPPEEEEPRPTQHHKDFGKAVDVSEINYLRGTEAEIELEFSKKGEIKRDKNGKPHYKLINKEHKPLRPIEVAWQVDPKELNAARHNKGLAFSPHLAAQQLVGNSLLSFLMGEIDRLGLIDFNDTGVNLAPAQNIIELVKLIGQAQMDKEFFTIKGVQLGKNALLGSGQKSLAASTKLPAFGFWGQTLEGASNQTPGFFINMGREVVTKNLGLLEGGLLGNTSDEILSSIGRRVFEEALGNLPVGTLEGIVADNQVSLEINVGRGMLANLLDLRVKDIPLNVSLAQFKQVLSLEFEYIEKNPILIENGLGLSGTNATAQMIAGAITPDAWLQKAGANRLKIISGYRRGDTALNIEERPELLEKFKAVPILSTSGLSHTRNLLDLISARAAWALDNFTFIPDDQTILEKAKSLIPPPTSIATPSEQVLLNEYGWIIDDVTGGSGAIEIVTGTTLTNNQFRAWLLDRSFVKGFDVSLYPRTDRFLRADLAVFKEVGIDRVAKALAKANDEKEAVRQYLKNDGLILVDEKNGAPIIDIDALSTNAGFRSRAEFDAVFLNNAPSLAFESVGRLNLLVALTGNEEFLVKQLPSNTDTPYHEKLLETLAALKTSAEDLRNDLPSNQRSLIDDEFNRAAAELKNFIEATVEVNKDKPPTQDQKVDWLFNQIVRADKWYQSLEVFYRVGHRSANIIEADKLSNYRVYSYTLAKLVHGISGEEIYSQETNLANVSGVDIREEMSKVITRQSTPNDALERIGAMVIEQFVGTQKGRIYNFYQDIKQVRSNPNPERFVNLIQNFARQNKVELYDFARSIGTSIDTNGLSQEEKIEAFAKAGVEAFMLSLPPQMAYGARIIDGLLGTQNFNASSINVNPETVALGFLGIVSHYAGPDVVSIVEEARRWQALSSLFLGRSEDFTQDKVGSHYPDMKLLWGAGSVGFQYSNDPDQLIDKNGGPILFAQKITGKTEEQLVADNPALGQLRVGQSYEDYERRWRDFAKDKIMDRNSDFWQNPSNVAHLQAVTQAAGAPGITVDALRFMFDKNMSKDEKGRLLETGFNTFVLNRINFTNDIFDIPSFAYDLIGLGRTLTNPNLSSQQKDEALKNFGFSLVDNITTTHYGFPVSWVFNDRISIEEKLSIGMNMLSETFDFPPEVTGIIAAGYGIYRSFFMDKQDLKFDPDTVEGRRNLAMVVNTVGNLSGVPTEYTMLASSLLTGDMETTVITYAGQSFIDNQLLSVGITDIGFVDIYEAFISPVGSTKNLILQKSWDRMGTTINESTLSSGEKVVNPYTGEIKFVNEKLASAWKNEVNHNKQDFQKEAQKRLQYSLMDRAVYFGLQGTIPISMGEIRGISRTMFEGKAEAKLFAIAGLMAKFAPSEAAQVILGAQASFALVKFFQTKDPSNLKEEDLQVIDSWFRQLTGWTDAPPGTFAAFLDFVKTGRTDAFQSLLQNDLVKMQLSGFVDQALGVPAGTAYTMWSAFEAYQVARAAVDTANLALANSYQAYQDAWLVASPGFEAGISAAATDLAKAKLAAEAAKKQLALTTASIVSTAVNLVFGKVFAQIEQSLGLPSGTIGLLVSAGIYALMVPSLTFAALFSTVLLPGIGFILLGVLLGGSIFGKKKIKKNIRVLLWSYTLENDLEKPKDKRSPGEVIDQTFARGKWPEEVDYVDPYDREGKIKHGDEIFLVAIADPQKFPKSGIFIDKNSFEAWKKRVASETITKFLGDLLTLDDRFDDEEMLPLQIATHSKANVEQYEGLINVKYGLEGEFEAGTYSKRLAETDQRKGVLFDTKAFLLHRWIHWQY